MADTCILVTGSHWLNIVMFMAARLCPGIHQVSIPDSRIYCAWIKVIAQKLFLSSVRCFGGFQIKTVRDLSSDGEVYLFISTDQVYKSTSSYRFFSFLKHPPILPLIGFGFWSKETSSPQPSQQSLSSVSWVHPRSSSQLGMPEKPHVGGSRRRSC